MLMRVDTERMSRVVSVFMRPQSRMAAVAELSLLLFALINNIHAEELITVQMKMHSYIFEVPKEANFCLISRLVGEEKLVLWNTSAHWSQNSTVPEDLKQRLVVGSDNISYVIQNLTHSDSGQYQEECWTEGNVTYEKNTSIIICNAQGGLTQIYGILGQHQDLPCVGAADNQDVQWLKAKFQIDRNIWTRVLRDSSTSVMDNVTGRPTTSTLNLFNLTAGNLEGYNCLVMNQEQCVRSHRVHLTVGATYACYSVEETAVLQCTIADASDDQPPFWVYQKIPLPTQELGRNYSLVLPSLKLNHTGLYACLTYTNRQMYWLLVCPKFDPPAVKLFSEGDEVIVRCRDFEKGMTIMWFRKSNQTEGRVFRIYDRTSDLRPRLNVANPDGSLVISNVSLEDTGEYWCAVFDKDDQCLSAPKTVLKHREPSEFDTLYTVRCYLLSGLQVVLCVVVAAVNQRTRRGEQSSAETDR